MTQINQIQQRIRNQIGRDIKVRENLKFFYKDFAHKATFKLIYRNSENLWHTNWGRGQEIFQHLEQTMQTVIRTRTGFREGYVYFNDVDDFISSIHSSHLQDLLTLDIMDQSLIDASQQFTHDYSVKLAVVKTLPWDTYRYKIYVNTSSKIRKRIGAQTMSAIANLLKSYDGIRFTDRFENHATRSYAYASGTYFYSQDLEWLPIVTMMDPRYIKNIEQFKTQTEINNEITSQNTN